MDGSDAVALQERRARVEAAGRSCFGLGYDELTRPGFVVPRGLLLQLAVGGAERAATGRNDGKAHRSTALIKAQRAACFRSSCPPAPLRIHQNF